MSARSDLPSATTADPLPRTVLAWQRTVPSIASLAVLMSVALARSGHWPWALPVLALSLLPLPSALRRERELQRAGPPQVGPGVLESVSAVVAALALAALVLVLAT